MVSGRAFRVKLGHFKSARSMPILGMPKKKARTLKDVNKRRQLIDNGTAIEVALKMENFFAFLFKVFFPRTFWSLT
jgi:hypothetical protein